MAIVIRDEPDADQLASVHARGPFGLYEGVPRTVYGADRMPVASKITLFRGPLMRAYRGHEALVEGVRETLDHEVAHQLGISDARLRELRTDADRRRRRSPDAGRERRYPRSMRPTRRR